MGDYLGVTDPDPHTHTCKPYTNPDSDCYSHVYSISHSYGHVYSISHSYGHSYRYGDVYSNSHRDSDGDGYCNRYRHANLCRHLWHAYLLLKPGRAVRSDNDNDW